jgi:hypothetical protein
MKNILLLCIISVQPALLAAQEQNVISKSYADVVPMPSDLFLKNISDHKVRSVRVISAPGYDGADRYLEFDREGKLTWSGEAHDRRNGTKIVYDDGNRIISTFTTYAGGRWLSNTSLVYDTLYKDVVARQDLLDSSGHIILPGSTTTVRRVQDTTLYITRRPVSSGAMGDKFSIYVKREIKVKDTLFVYTYPLDPDDDKKDRFTYRIYSNGALRQEGEITDEPYKCVDCCPPVVAPFVATYVRQQESAMVARIKKENPELLPELKKALAEREKKGKRTWLTATACYKYESDGRITEKLMMGGSYVLHYVYDTYGHLVRINQTPGNIGIDFRYNDQGVLTGYKNTTGEVKLECTFY